MQMTVHDSNLKNHLKLDFNASELFLCEVL